MKNPKTFEDFVFWCTLTMGKNGYEILPRVTGKISGEWAHQVTVFWKYTNHQNVHIYICKSAVNMWHLMYNMVDYICIIVHLR